MATKKYVSKYAGIVDKLPKFNGIEEDRLDVIEAMKAEILAPPTEDEQATFDEQLVARRILEADAAIKAAIHDIKRSTNGRRWASEFARAYADARDLRDQIDAWALAAGILIEALQVLMVEQMEAEGMSSMKLASGRPISTFPEPYAIVQDRIQFQHWCMRDPDLRGKLTLPWQTINSLTKERLLAGEPEPPGVTAYVRTRVRLGGE